MEKQLSLEAFGVKIVTIRSSRSIWRMVPPLLLVMWQRRLIILSHLLISRVTDQLPNGARCPNLFFLRQVQFQVVSQDSNGAAPVGNVVVRELFDSLSNNSCGNGLPMASGCAPTINNGTFLENISPGCGSATGPANCGYDINWSWHWCGSVNSPLVKLASLNAQVRRDGVTLNGRSGPWPPGTPFRP